MLRASQPLLIVSLSIPSITLLIAVQVCPPSVVLSMPEFVVAAYTVCPSWETASARTFASDEFASFAWLGGLIAKLKPTATALLVRIGGLLLATIGTQMLLGGLKAYFGG